jgi:UDP-N-acetylmuramoyl-L-alanyl-D-glutamate--2,6-diaminopimelate ligase
MAQVVAQLSDYVVLTSDDPRNEDPQDIINDMLAGLDKVQMEKVTSIIDRKEAIQKACEMAKKGDVVLVAGKGHEKRQVIKGVEVYFSDMEVLGEIFSK